MALALSAILFGVFVLNVFLGATSRTHFMGDVQEMIVLFAASIAFVAAILRREAREQERKSENPQGGTNGH